MPGKYTDAISQTECTMCTPGKHGNWNPYYVGGYTALTEKPWTANPNCIDCTYNVQFPPDGTGIFADEVPRTLLRTLLRTLPRTLSVVNRSTSARRAALSSLRKPKHIHNHPPVRR